MSDTERVRDLLGRASQASSSGNPAQAIKFLNDAIALSSVNPAAHNSMGVVLMKVGRHGEAADAFARAIEADSDAASLHLNLATALENAGQPEAALAAIDQALERDAYMLPALLRKARLLELLGQADHAVRCYRALFQALPPTGGLGSEYDDALQHGRALVARDGGDRRDRLNLIPQIAAARSAGARAYLDQICGLRKVYPSNPTGPHFPFLPAIEFFDRRLMPWLVTLEQACDTITQELLCLWREDAPGFQPYIRYDPTKPLNQWRDLNESRRWSAFSFWDSGQPNEANCARCPATAQLLASLPMFDIHRKAPAALFSVLAPKTRIPPHTGTTNTRAIVHLPLVVPNGCGFRVGGDTRQWVKGEAWAFDDTIEHEAWNDSDQPRAILILDIWNPLLSAEDREIVRQSSSEIRL